MNRDIIDTWLEKGIFAFVLAILVYGPLAMGAVNPLHFAVIEGLTLGVILLWVLRLWVGKNARLLWTPICWAVTAFAAYAVVRYAMADLEYVARQELARVLVYAVVFLALHNNLYGQENLRRMVLVLVFLAMVIAAYALYQYFTDSDRVWTYFKPYENRASGTYISPNHLGGFLEMVLPLALACTLLARFKALTKVFIGYAALVILAAIAVTFSRGAWLATLAATILFFGVLLFRRSHRIPALVFLVLILGGAAVLIPKDFAFRNRLQQLSHTEATINSGLRFEIWTAAIQMWKDNPLVGVGPGHFDYRFREYRPAAVQLRPDRVHNDYLNTLADWGLLGLGIIAASVLLLVRGSYRTWQRVGSKFNDLGEQGNSTKAALVLGAAAGLLAILVHSFTDFNMHIPANALIAVALMAILSAHLRFASDDFWTGKRVWIRAVASLALLGCAVFLAAQIPRQVGHERLLRQARATRLFSLEQAALLEKAFAHEPGNPETAYAIAEVYRVQSMEGGSDYREQGEQALRWYRTAANLNRYDGYAFLRQALMLEWLEQPGEVSKLIDLADRLDPNGYFTMAHIGLHYVNQGNYAAARSWFERSARLLWSDNPIAHRYLEICDRKLQEAAQTRNLPLQVPR